MLFEQLFRASHPSRVRELKLEDDARPHLLIQSHPSRVRELKPDFDDLRRCSFDVAPLPGA